MRQAGQGKWFSTRKKLQNCNLKRKRKHGEAGSTVRAIILYRIGKLKNHTKLTFLNVLNPARIDPPIHVLYFRSGGANILIFISLTARRRTSERRRSPNPVCCHDVVSCRGGTGAHITARIIAHIQSPGATHLPTGQGVKTRTRQNITYLWLGWTRLIEQYFQIMPFLNPYPSC